MIGDSEIIVDNSRRKRLGVNDSGWPEAEVEKLKGLIKRDLSAREIGVAMGRTRNSIIGKVRRLGLTLARAWTEPKMKLTRAKRLTSNITVRRKPAMTQKPPPGRPSSRPKGWDRPVSAPIVPVNGGVGITILELSHDKCHTVIGSSRPDKGLPHYCGRPTWGGTHYCEDHYAVFHKPPQPRR